MSSRRCAQCWDHSTHGNTSCHRGKDHDQAYRCRRLANVPSTHIYMTAIHQPPTYLAAHQMGAIPLGTLSILPTPIFRHAAVSPAAPLGPSHFTTSKVRTTYRFEYSTVTAGSLWVVGNNRRLGCHALIPGCVWQALPRSFFIRCCITLQHGETSVLKIASLAGTSRDLNCPPLAILHIWNPAPLLSILPFLLPIFLHSILVFDHHLLIA